MFQSCSPVVKPNPQVFVVLSSTDQLWANRPFNEGFVRVFPEYDDLSFLHIQLQSIFDII